MNDKATILIVDDNLDNLRLLFEKLREAGYAVMVAQNGTSAFTRVAARKPDLILLDVIMPDINGFDVAARLKGHPSSQDIPIIFLTAVDETDSIVRGFAVGGVDYLVKPVRMEEALARIHTHISLHRLQSRMEARTRELGSLLKLSHSLTSTLELEPLTTMILDQLKTVVDYTGCALLSLTGEKLCMLAYRGSTLPEEILQTCFRSKIGNIDHESSVPQQPWVIDDVHTDESLRSLFHHYGRERVHPLLRNVHAWMCIPLSFRQQIIGALSLSHDQPGFYTTQQVELATAFAEHAAIAIENARLHQEAKTIAVHEERNRLARTLHDSVTQSLFSANLIAEVLPQIWLTDPAEAQRGLTELQRLTQGAIMQMRTLLLELRPATLLKTRLDDLLRQLGHTIMDQTGLHVSLDLTPVPDLPPDVHITFYRVAQEAFNNITRHAEARCVTVALHTIPTGCLTLDIWDNGQGFDTIQPHSGKLGLEIMHERAQQIAASLTIASQPGQGTRVTLSWPDN